MTNGFEDIRIVSIDVSASSRTFPASVLMNIVFNLSSTAPGEWSSIFNFRWSNHIYVMKRGAHICAHHLEICCVPEELESFHLPELKAIITETNQVYRQFLARERHFAAGESARTILDKDKLLEALTKNIKFE